MGEGYPTSGTYQYNGERSEERFIKTIYYFNDHNAQGCSIM